MLTLHSKSYTIWLLLLAVGLLGCRVNKTRQTPIFTAESYCYAAPPTAPYFDSLWAIRTQRDTTFSPEVRKYFSQRARSVAADIGIQATLMQWVLLQSKLKKIPTNENRVNLLLARQEITERILLATQELNTVLAEIECEQTRAAELKNYLQQHNDRRVNKLTILSVLAGALSTVMSGTLAIAGADDPYVEGAAMGGALLSGYWGLRALGGYEEAHFSHKRNHLIDIRDNPDVSDIYPPMVWHFLTRELEPDKQTRTVRETIMERWQELDILTEAESDEQRVRNELLFGPGGRYTLDAINLRISLLELLQVEINIMNQELKQLQQELILDL